MQLIPPVQSAKWQSATSQVLLPELSQLTYHDELPFTSEHDETLSEQGYRISIGQHSLSVAYKDLAGRWNALQTLRQLAKQDSLACGEIIDWPSMPVRGVLLDISRDRVPSMEKLKELLTLWSQLKYNQVQLYMEAAFAYQGEEAAWQGRSPITASELDEIRLWCDDLGLELVANQATFGHMENWLDKPEYQHLAENLGGCYDGHGNFRNHSFCLSAVNPQARQFVERLLDELLPHFTSPWVNVNCDETFDLGVGDSAQSCEARGKGRVYLDYVNAIAQMLATRGRRMMLWADIIINYPELVPELPGNAIAMNWGYEADHDWDGSCKLLQDAGVQHYVVAGTATFAALTGRWHNAKTNVEQAIAAAVKYKASGFYMSEWGDFGHAQPWVAGYPAMIYGACAAWQPQCLPGVDIEQALANVMNQDCIAPLMQLADSYLHTQTANQLPGVGIYGALLFNQMTNRHMKKVKHWSVDGFKKAQAQCEDALQQLEQASEGNVQRECLITAKLAVFANKLGVALSQQQDYRVEALPTQTKRELAGELAQLIPPYQQAWRQESREGGLADSTSRLAFLQQTLAQ